MLWLTNVNTHMHVEFMVILILHFWKSPVFLAGEKYGSNSQIRVVYNMVTLTLAMAHGIKSHLSASKNSWTFQLSCQDRRLFCPQGTSRHHLGLRLHHRLYLVVRLLLCCVVHLSVCNVLYCGYTVRREGSAMVPLDRTLVSSYRLSIVTMLLSAAVWPQFATQVFSRDTRSLFYRKLCK